MIADANLLLTHLPHLALLGGSIVVFSWYWFRQPDPNGPSEKRPHAIAQHDEVGRSQGRARASVARRGLLALGPLLAAASSGAVLYGIEIADGRPGAGAIWIHVGISLLVVLLAGYKLREVGLASVSAALEPGRLLTAGASLLFSALLVPLLITGVLLIPAPSYSSFTAYIHLVCAAWWTLLLVWHLRLHLTGALAAVKGRRAPRPYLET